MSKQYDKDHKPFWRCDECLHESHKKPMPSDREGFYASVNRNGSPTCPNCGSPSFMPVNF